MDYAYTRRPANPPITFTYELRNRASFVIPPTLIIPSGEETLDSLVTLHEAALSLGYLKPRN